MDHHERSFAATNCEAPKHDLADALINSEANDCSSFVQVGSPLRPLLAWLDPRNHKERNQGELNPSLDLAIAAAANVGGLQ